MTVGRHAEPSPEAHGERTFDVRPCSRDIWTMIRPSLLRCSSLFLAAVLFAGVAACNPPVEGPVARTAADGAPKDLWAVYAGWPSKAKYIDLTHTIAPGIPVWAGFGPSTFGPTENPKTHAPYSYATDGFEATQYHLSTDQLGTQLDPPAHWAPEYPAIDELPPTFALRPLVVISIVEQVAKNPGYHLQVADIEAWGEGSPNGSKMSGLSHPPLKST